MNSEQISETHKFLTGGFATTQSEVALWEVGHVTTFTAY